jgi:hypothetical protein
LANAQRNSLIGSAQTTSPHTSLAPSSPTFAHHTIGYVNGISSGVSNNPLYSTVTLTKEKGEKTLMPSIVNTMAPIEQDTTTTQSFLSPSKINTTTLSPSISTKLKNNNITVPATSSLTTYNSAQLPNINLSSNDEHNLIANYSMRLASYYNMQASNNGVDAAITQSPQARARHQHTTGSMSSTQPISSFSSGVQHRNKITFESNFDEGECPRADADIFPESVSVHQPLLNNIHKTSSLCRSNVLNSRKINGALTPDNDLNGAGVATLNSHLRMGTASLYSNKDPINCYGAQMNDSKLNNTTRSLSEMNFRLSNQNVIYGRGNEDEETTENQAYLTMNGIRGQLPHRRHRRLYNMPSQSTTMSATGISNAKLPSIMKSGGKNVYGKGNLTSLSSGVQQRDDSEE